MLLKGQSKVLFSYRRNQSSTDVKESSGTNARHRVIVNIFYETVELFAMFGQMPKKFVNSASELQCLKEERDVMKQNSTGERPIYLIGHPVSCVSDGEQMTEMLQQND